mmetsp:Transcript_11986/g.15781  ORF Transcript_11986/g.15781 Transcript_11986/m.15781 type:complete len:213 (-) Transcript_11986:35-673(-)
MDRTPKESYMILGGDVNVDDLDLFKRAIQFITFGALDGLHHVHSLVHPAEDGVFVVKPGAWHRRDKELRTVCPGTGVGHGDGERAVMAEVPVKLVFKLGPPDGLPTSTITERVPGLNHEPLDHAVEEQPIVVPIAGVNGKVFDGLRALDAEELDVNIAHGGSDDRFLAENGRLLRLHHHLLSSGSLVEDVTPLCIRLTGWPLGEEEEATLLE